MSFTIKCDKCGQNHILNEGNIFIEKPFEIETYQDDSGGKSISIWCKKCGNGIEENTW